MGWIVSRLGKKLVTTPHGCSEARGFSVHSCSVISIGAPKARSEPDQSGYVP